MRGTVTESTTVAVSLWRALVWALIEGRNRYAIPCYHRDEVAQCLGLDRKATQLVRWEYEVDVELPDWGTADYGFLRPAGDTSDIDHVGFAGLFEVNSLQQLIDIDRVIACDNTSELTEFGHHDSGRRASRPQRSPRATAPIWPPFWSPAASTRGDDRLPGRQLRKQGERCHGCKPTSATHSESRSGWR
jgi:hypothetical protein